MFVSLAAVAACLALPLSLHAEDMNGNNSSNNSTNVSNDANSTTTHDTELSHIDKSFTEKAAKGGAMEVAISQVAVQRSTNPQVKAFAEKMVEEHTSANESLMSIASATNVKLPEKEVDTDKWTKKDASEFDKDYVDKMVSDHKETVELFQKEADKGKDAELTAFARKTLPTIQEHLEHAEDLQRSLKSQ